jgi:hypothetical protein
MALLVGCHDQHVSTIIAKVRLTGNVFVQGPVRVTVLFLCHGVLALAGG